MEILSRQLTVHVDNEALLREESFMGSDYLVVPVILLQEGVYKAPGGRKEFLSRDTLAKSVGTGMWEGRSLTCPNHPQDATGQLALAGTQAIAEQYEAGRLWNVGLSADQTRAKGELWIDLSRIDEVEGGADAVALLKGEGGDEDDGDEMLEVSAGYLTFADPESKGRFKGQTYEAEQLMLTPDHVALLPYTTGQCSVKKGCGAPRLNAEPSEPQVDDSESQANELEPEDNVDSDDGKRANTECEQRRTAMTFLRELFFGAPEPRENELSHRERFNLVDVALTEEFGGDDVYLWIIDLWEERVVFSRWADGEEREMLQVGLEMEEPDEGEATVSFDGEPIQVRIEYMPVTEKRENSKTEGDEMKDTERAALLETLAAEDQCPFDAEGLKPLSDEQLAYLSDGLEEEPAPEGGAEGGTEGGDDDADKEKDAAATGAPAVVEPTAEAKELAEAKCALAKQVAGEVEGMEEADLAKLPLVQLQALVAKVTADPTVRVFAGAEGAAGTIDGDNMPARWFDGIAWRYDEKPAD